MSYRWQNRHEQPGHTDDWLMTYADTITLLLCFFVVLLIVSIAKKDPPHPDTQQTVAAIETTPVSKPEEKLQMKPLPDPNDLPFHKIEPQDFTEAAPLAVPVVPDVVPPPPVPVVPTVQAENPPPPPPPPVVDKSDRITTFEMNSAAFFDSGSAVLNASGGTILKDMAVKLNSDEFKDYQITVEGHTDDTPIHTTEFPSNWELSTARASAVVHFFLEQGIPAQRLRAAGYADTFPKAPNRDANGNAIPANQAQNRRVVIRLEKIDKAQ